jgi:hypothetical protein
MLPSKIQSLSSQRLSERPGRLGIHIMDADASGRLIVLIGSIAGSSESWIGAHQNGPIRLD